MISLHYFFITALLWFRLTGYQRFYSQYRF